MMRIQAQAIPRTRCLSLLLACGLAVLSACGGGSGGKAGVAQLQATGVAFNRTLTVTVNGTGLTNDNLQMIVEGPCGPVTKVAGGTDLQLLFTCKVTDVGDLIPRIRTGENVELASLRLNVGLPQVAMQVRQGTRSGTIVMELDAKAAPISAKNFLDYVDSGFYASTIFHRVEAGVVVQGGGYNTGPVVKPSTRPSIALESNNGLKNLRYTLGMARASAVDSATSQFYINLVDNPAFDYVSADQPGYAVFGKVVTGQDVVDEMAKVEVAARGAGLGFVPVADVVVNNAQQAK